MCLCRSIKGNLYLQKQLTEKCWLSALFRIPFTHYIFIEQLVCARDCSFINCNIKASIVPTLSEPIRLKITNLSESIIWYQIVTTALKEKQGKKGKRQDRNVLL